MKLPPLNAVKFDALDNHSKQQIHLARETLVNQRKAFNAQPYPSEKLRKQQIKALHRALIKHKDKLVKAIEADFGHRSTDETLLTDILLSVLDIKYNLKHLRQWMRPQKCGVNWLFQPALARIMYQPLGVVGIISPWNFPVYLLISPLVAAIAAGNRVILKPSEKSPYCNRVLQEIISEAFLKDEVTMIEGGPEVSQAFSELPFDHLMFTGSPKVGRKIMQTAARNLTPVTLELGGKSPVIIAPDMPINSAVERIIFGKCVNSGQHCVAPDYVYCPENKLDELISEFKRQFTQLYPDIYNGDYTGIVSDEHFGRLKHLLKDAKDKGATAIPLAPTEPKSTTARNLTTVDTPKTTIQQRIMPLTLLTHIQTNMSVMKEEIFGPILPIIIYKNLHQIIDSIQASPRPLAMYILSKKNAFAQQIMYATHSGGVSINDAGWQVAQNDLPFGGIGNSGMGSYHGHQGFLTFSHGKSIYRRGWFNTAKLMFPPYRNFIHRFLYRWYLK
ncbi:coniferyl aldehyde dehydrogenase [Aliikangiella maris]|uniref:Coniferyl aldehyde dehydrogenase n=2 Tax=Aliikangiella maris TaxID=3162458 RepID=A0ABV2BTB9_9GAMM